MTDYVMRHWLTALEFGQARGPGEVMGATLKTPELLDAAYTMRVKHITAERALDGMSAMLVGKQGIPRMKSLPRPTGAQCAQVLFSVLGGLLWDRLRGEMWT